MSKLKTVIRHEYLTIVKQPSFWLTMILIPVLIGLIIALNYFSSTSASERIEELAKDLKKVAIVDQSGLVNREVVTASGLTLSAADQAEALQQSVRNGEQDALIVYPADLAKERDYKIYLNGNDITKFSSVSSLGNSILQTSLFLPLGSAEIIALAQEGPSTTLITYENGVQTAGINEYIAPGLFVVLFYMIFAFSVGYMLTSVSEEKENRSMEMVLTYVEPKTLILGKLLAVSLVTLTQIAFFGLLTGAGYLIMREMGGSISLPMGIDITQIVFNPVTLFFAAAYLVVGFLMYAGFMTATAAAAPSTKEANGFSSVFFIGAFVPFYFISMIVTDPTNPVIQFLSYFPLTSPVTSLIRNTVGNIGSIEAWLILAAMSVGMVLSIWIAVKAFKLGALEYSQTLNLAKLFRR